MSGVRRGNTTAQSIHFYQNQNLNRLSNGDISEEVDHLPTGTTKRTIDNP